MNLRVIFHSVLCLLAVAYLLVANAYGYVPFATPTEHASQGTANHFHK
jgi:hypothetical protein